MKRRYRVLVVDDEEDIRTLVRQALMNAGFEVSEAAGGREALDVIKDIKPHLVLLDVMMPDIDGWDVCREIKADPETRHITVSMLTVKIHDKDKVRSLDYAKADWHISKPIDLLKLPETVLWLLESPLGRAGR